MYEYKDISALTRTTIVLLWIYLAGHLLFGGTEFYATGVLAGPTPPGTLAAVGLTGLLQVLTALAAFIVVGRWIYRASANAHAIGGGLSITPGWAVGWYFVPFANLVKPFEAMKETWLASHYGSDWGRGDATDLLNWWWGLWIVTNILANAAWRLDDVPGLGLAAAVLDIPLTLILITLLKQIRDAQRVVHHAEVFA